MPRRLASLVIAALSGLAVTARAEEPPKGEILKFTFAESQIFPGTTRDVSVYVPKQYDPAKPACLHVNQDGIQYDAPAVFDRLIQDGQLPVIVGVFVTPGKVKAEDGQGFDRINRGFEYDSLGDAYVRFLLEEILPRVETMKTTDGRPIRLSRDGNDRAIAGASSGAICAFTAAWERPDAFRRVFSAIGTFVDLRGGNIYPSLIRKYEPKPIRVFLQDGRNDLNNYGGHWWTANQDMERALTFAGYEVEHSWGDGGHSTKDATRVFPEAVQWLWKGWPAPVKAGSGPPFVQEILDPGQGWTLVSEGHARVLGLAASANGEVVFNDPPQRQGVPRRPRRQGRPPAGQPGHGRPPSLRRRRPPVRRRRRCRGPHRSRRRRARQGVPLPRPRGPPPGRLPRVEPRRPGRG